MHMETQNLKLLNGKILVEFDQAPKLSEKFDLVAPERYLVYESDSEHEHNRWGVNTDRRAINPQIVTVIQGNEYIPSGSRCFVYYGAYEAKQRFIDNQYFIDCQNVLFFIEPMRMAFDNYLAKEIEQEGEKTDSGIWITPHTHITLPLNVIITHVPEGSDIQPGTEVITIDSFQYKLTFKDEKSVKLTDHEIIAKVIDGEIIPRGQYMLVEYIEPELTELEKENEYRKHMADVFDRYKIAVPKVDIAEKPLPKSVDCRIIRLGDSFNHRTSNVKPEEVYHIHRDRGLKLPDGRWIIREDAILYTYA